MSFDFDSFSKVRVMVVGDIMLDLYHWGEVRRISPEGPVPVVRVLDKSRVLGGAGNVAANLAGLGCGITLLGLCGEDEPARQLETLCTEKKIEHLFYRDPSRPTITKTRIMAQGQQLFRLDEESPGPISPEISDWLITVMEEQLAGCQAVIMSDYGKGLLSSVDLCRIIIRMSRDRNLPVLVDPKGTDWERYQGATAVTPNLAELGLLEGASFQKNEADLQTAVKAVRKRYYLDWLLVTQGARGMSFTGAEEEVTHIPAVAREVFDVSGAGDTVIATLSAALASGLPFPAAAEMANTSAGIVVGKLGTQPVTRSELASMHGRHSEAGQAAGYGHPAPLDAARIQVQSWRASGGRIVFTNGCFDLLHPGHINLLHQSRALGDRLVVGLNTDASVKRLKGENRPILSEIDRAAILSALASVDLVVLFDEDTPLALIKSLKPDILVKGADYRLEEVVGREAVESWDGQVCLVPLLKGYSTTGIADRVLSATEKP
jgi:D-beta-D-heptose 7-phosphate kinase/D-beta-D-heptose 1-phosphate adenosyltransferase